METPPGTPSPSRRRHRLAWELLACGFGGHTLIGTDAAEIRSQDALFVRGDGSVRWHRCLRCDTWLALPPPASPSRTHPPEREEISVPLRGKALRDKAVLRLIAVDRALHFLLLGLLGIAVLVFAGHENALRRSFYTIMTNLQSGIAGGPVQNTGRVGILHQLDRLFSLRTGTVREVGIALLAYAALEGTEAVGLWLTKRWAEYLTFIATTVLLPLEVYELAHRATALKVIGFLINLAVVIYLVFAKRLFGLRGGARAEQAERNQEMGWDAIERATPPALNTA